jgi:hypothetical protein
MPPLARVAVLLLFAAPSCSVQSLQPVWMQPLHPGWIADVRTGCKVWDSVPVHNESVTWAGVCQNGIAQGRGTLQWFQDGKPTDRYEGGLLDGKRSGKGVYTYVAGDRYEGEFHDDKRNGQGISINTSGTRYEGAFRDDKETGQGVMTWPDGAHYEGNFVDGTRTGQGVFTSRNGDHKEGLWRNGDFIEGGSVAAIQAHPNPQAQASPYSDGIRLAKEGGVLVVPVGINGAITLNFLVDSGAADVSIPADVVLTLFRTGTLSETDFLGKRTYTLADGRTVPSETFRIRVLRVGNREIRNVIGSVADVRSAPLLGQSFLSRFKSWSIDNQRQMLVLE